MNYRTW